MDNSNHTKKQHYVPRFYLKNFVNQNGDLNVLNLKDERMEKPTHDKSVCYEYYFYAAKTGMPDELSQYIEKVFHPLENSIPKKLPDIINKIHKNQQILDDDRKIIANLMSMLWVRTPNMRNKIQQIANHTIKQVRKLNPKENIEPYKIKNNIIHLDFINEVICNIDSFSNLFYNMNWIIYIARGKETFITSDSPVVEFYQPPTSPLESPNLKKTVFFPLTSQILIKLNFQSNLEKIKPIIIFEEDEMKIKSLNMIISNHSQKYAFSNNEKNLIELLDTIKNPNKYIEKYKKLQKNKKEIKNV